MDFPSGLGNQVFASIGAGRDGVLRVPRSEVLRIECRGQKAMGICDRRMGGFLPCAGEGWNHLFWVVGQEFLRFKAGRFEKMGIQDGWRDSVLPRHRERWNDLFR